MSKESLIKLSPPWYTFFNFVKHSVGNDRCVEVCDMKEISEREFLIQVDVKDRSRAIAMATILVPCKNFGNIDVHIEVSHCGRAICPNDRCLDVRNLVRFIEEAFCTNGYFEYVESVKMFGADIVFPVFTKGVIQFFNDDISDLYNNYNGVIADVFAEVLRLEINEIQINPSTAVRS